MLNARWLSRCLSFGEIRKLCCASQVFKRHMDALLEPLFASLACDHQLCRAAAGRCIGQLRDFVGPGIWAGHLTDSQAAAMARSPDVPAPAGECFCLHLWDGFSHVHHSPAPAGECFCLHLLNGSLFCISPLAPAGECLSTSPEWFPSCTSLLCAQAQLGSTSQLGCAALKGTIPFCGISLPKYSAAGRGYSYVR